jgi:TolB-like protein/DNA-binding SARP family transcriptional activator/Tfp pilus assembly protein PilF
VSRIHLRTLGTLRIERDGVELRDLPSQPIRCALLLYLALERSATREELLGLLWPDRDPERARHSLRQTLYELRRALGDEWSETHGDRIETTERVTADALEFVEAVEAGRDDDALETYAGPFLEGGHPGTTPAFERWSDGWRARLARRHRELCRRLGAARSTGGDLEGALAVARRWTEADPMDDEAQHRLISLLAESGRRTEALRQYERYEALIGRELEIEPLEETRALVRRIRAGEAPLTPVGGAPGSGETAEPKEAAAAPPGATPATPAGTGRTTPPPPVGIPALPGRRRAFAGVAAAALLALVLVLGPADEIDPPLPPGPFPSSGGIAVLPFANWSADPDQEYFSDGVTEDLITALSRLEGLRVISRTSVMRYKGTSLSSPEIGSELDVEYLLEGTVRREANEVRITAQLIHAATDGHLWADAYDRDVTDVFAVQSEIAATIASALEQRLLPGGSEGMASGGTRDPTAYDLFLRGREYLNRPGEGDLRKYALAMDFFRRALDLDPAYAHGHAGLAQAFRRHVALPLAPVRRDSVLHHASRAVELAPDLVEGITELGFGHLYAGDHDSAESAFQRALTLDPNHAHALDGMARLAAVRGRLDHAASWQARAVAVDPLSSERLHHMGAYLFDLGDLDAAEVHFERAVRLAPDHPEASFLLAQVHLLRSDQDAADARIETLMTVAGDHPGAEFMLAAHLAATGRLREADATLEGKPFAESPAVKVFRAIVARALGEPERALELFRDPDALLVSWESEGLSIPPRGRLARHVLHGDRDGALDVIRNEWRTGLRWVEDPPAVGIYWLDRDLVVTELVDDPRFQALLREMRQELDEMRARLVMP